MYRIIIVDDEPKIGEGLVHLFPWENLGFEVAGFFTDGKTALDYINTHQDIDVVMTDIQMPGMTGIELSQNLLDSNIIVIFFSAYQDFEYARSAIINHVVDYLIKPMKYDAMAACFERVRNLLDNKNPSNALNSAVFSSSHDNLVKTVKEYLEKNYRTASLEEAALLVHFSTSYLSSTFKAAAGISFSDYLLKIRMEKALSLLSNDNYKLYDIADTIGYVNPKNLSRNFKDYYKITPQEYRMGKKPVIPGSNDIESENND